MSKSKTTDLYCTLVQNIGNITGNDGRLVLSTISIPNWSPNSQLPEGIVSLDTGFPPSYETVYHHTFTTETYDITILIKHIANTKVDTDPSFHFVLKFIPLSDNALMQVNLLSYHYIDYDTLMKILNYLVEQFSNMTNEVLDAMTEYAPNCIYEITRKGRRFRFDNRNQKELRMKVNGEVYCISKMDVVDDVVTLTFKKPGPEN